MVREVLTYPNPKLRVKSKDVKCFDDDLRALLDDMYETMLFKGGVGLAAIQVGEEQNVLIVNPADENETQQKENLIEMINPKFLETSGSCLFQEGCLSVPNIYEDIERFEKIKIEFFDRYGKSHTREYDGFLAIAIQHEMDHLNGRLFIEKLTYLKRKKFEKEWKKQIKNKT